MFKKILYAVLSVMFFVVLFIGVVILSDTFFNKETTFFERYDVSKMVENVERGV